MQEAWELGFSELTETQELEKARHPEWMGVSACVIWTATGLLIKIETPPKVSWECPKTLAWLCPFLIPLNSVCARKRYSLRQISRDWETFFLSETCNTEFFINGHFLPFIFSDGFIKKTNLNCFYNLKLLSSERSLP